MNDATLTPLQHPVSLQPAEPTFARQWSRLQRIGFRFSFSYFILYALMNGNISLFAAIPVIGRSIQQGLAWPGMQLARALGDHVFYLTGPAARWHGGGSGDTALHYLVVLGFGLTAMVATVVWSVLDARRPDYRVLLFWLRWLLRFTVAGTMIFYGLAKLFPLQMRPPSLGILTNTFGNSSPMTLLWTLLGLNPLYQMFCGAAEVAAGLLLFVRPTATLGVILALALSANIVLYNFFFDVPVKLFASHLLCMSAFLLIPDVPALWRLFVRQQPAQLTDGWNPHFRRPRARQIMTIAEAVIAIAMIGQVVFFMQKSWRQHRDAQAPTPLTGAWQVETIEAENRAARPLSPEGEPWIALYIDDQRSGFYRSRDGAIWRCNFQYNAAAKKLGVRGVKFSADYTWEISQDQLVLSQKTAGKPVTITLRRIDTSAGFPLMKRGFRWVNEWGYER
jgi:hypothetical protein